MSRDKNVPVWGKDLFSPERQRQANGAINLGLSAAACVVSTEEKDKLLEQAAQSIKSEGGSMSQEDICRIFTTKNDFAEASSGYFFAWLLAGSYSTEAREEIHSYASLISSRDNSPSAEAARHVVSKIEEGLDVIAEMDIMRESPGDAPSLREIIGSTWANDRVKNALDPFFRNSEEAHDVGLMFFLFSFVIDQEWKLEQTKRNFQKKNAPKHLQSELIKLSSATKTYFQSYYWACVERFFPKTFGEANETSDIFPPDSSVLAIATGAYFIGILDIVPSQVEMLLRDGFIPGLSKESARRLTDAYTEYFATTYAHLDLLVDADKIFPYRQAKEEGVDIEVLSSAVERHRANTNTENIGAEEEALKALIASDKFARIRDFLIKSGKVHTVHKDKDLTVEISTSGQNVIDFILKSNGKLYIVSLDTGGRIIGIPQDSLESRDFIRWAAKAAFDYLSVSSPVYKDKYRRPAHQYARTPAQRTSSAMLQATPAEESVLVMPRVPKRKTRRFDESTTIAAETSSEEATQKPIKLRFSDEFMEQLKALPGDVQTAAIRALQKIRLRQKPPKYLGMSRELETNLYSVRIPNYRIVLTGDIATGDLEGFSITSRENLYKNLERQLKRLSLYQEEWTN